MTGSIELINGITKPTPRAKRVASTEGTGLKDPVNFS
jgi:hypothetical protein